MKSVLPAVLFSLIIQSSTYAGDAPILPDGIYAVWESTHGNMTGLLYQVEAPVAVANFVGLAEGTQTWVDEETLRLRNDPYYDGHNVFRVAELGVSPDSTIIQTGSQNGTNGGGGPGYTFQDEFDASLRHDRFGIVSMANSGRHTNGSQYFFNRGPNPHLDDVHTIFGIIVGGGEVLDTIASIPRTGTVPNTEVLFNRVYILRIGAAAQAYDPTGIAPVAAGVDFEMNAPVSTLTSDNYTITYERDTNTYYNILVGGSLDSMTRVNRTLVLGDTTPDPFTRQESLSTDMNFCSMFKVGHPSMTTPYDFPGLKITNTTNDLEIRFSPDGSTGTVNVNNGAFIGDITQAAFGLNSLYHATLDITYVGFTPPRMVLDLDFARSVTNRYTGEVLDDEGALVFRIGGEFIHSQD